MATKNSTNLKQSFKDVTITRIQDLENIADSAQLLAPGTNTLPTSDPTTAGSLFITGSSGMNLGPITGSGFAILCVSQG